MMNISSEQKIAINHSGGVLLNAGAGSGKTAVLVEHLILLIDNCIKDYSKENLPSFSNFFRSRFSRVVFMTFTNKAADEIYLRIKARIEKKKQESSYWEIVKTHLDVIKITTIHGFCLNLLKQGFFSQVGSHIEVLSKSEWEEHLRGLYLEWIEFKKQNKQQKELLETLIHNENSMTSALQKIFENPTLRLAWKESTDQNKAPQDIWPWFKEILKLNDLQALFEEVVPLKSVSDQDYSEIYELLDKFQKLRQIEHFDHDTFKLYQELFSMERWKRVPKKLADDL
ncbi:MAG: UvrD-helicase domain-containing protein, partial [Bacteriovoracaceae bacterium]|nr:UvrD-helicase domain-containing protein [Bacteriovoracaceae bacterium]